MKKLRIMNKLKIQMAKPFAKFFKLMLHQGINLAPSKFEAWFLTTEHTEEDIDQTLEAADYAFSQMKN